MGLPAEKRKWFSLDEYFRMADDSEVKLEYWEGEIVEMAGGTYEHSLVISNTLLELGNSLKGKPCRVLESNLRVRIGRKSFYCYPDLKVICGTPQFDLDDPKKLTVFNPRVIIEVLSPSTEGYDRGQKFERYRDIASMQEYVLISTQRPLVEVFWRRDDGSWLFTPASGVESSTVFNSIDVKLNLSDIYAGVEFPPEKLESDAPPDEQQHA